MPRASQLFALVIVFTLAACTVAKIAYDGYHLFRVTVDNDDQLDYLHSLENKRGGSIKARFFRSPMLNRTIDILVAPESVDSFKKELEARRIRHTIRSEDFQKAIDSEQGKEEPPVRAFKDNASPQSTLITSRYLKLNEIESYLAALAKDYPNLVQLENIGTTYENKPLTLVKVGSKSSAGYKPAMWIDSGIHSREWIAPAVGLYILNKLVTTSQRNSTIGPYIDNLNWYFLPVMNPDGYEYTHTQDRMWRKNRRRSATARCTAAWFDDDCCEGVDLNRNFGYKWGGPGASADPCDEIYRGPSAFSEPESKAVRDYILRHGDVKGFITMHSYSQMWFYPFGDRKRSYPLDKDDLHSVATKATEALKSVYGTQYKVGTAADILYESSGGSDDWVKAVANIKYVYGIELRPSDDDSRYGFILPASYIVPTGEETWAAVRVVADEVVKGFSSTGAGSTVSTSNVTPNQSLNPSINSNTFPISPPRPPCNNKSSSCWWFQAAGYCENNHIRNLCPLTCNAC